MWDGGAYLIALVGIIAIWLGVITFRIDAVVAKLEEIRKLLGGEL